METYRRRNKKLNLTRTELIIDVAVLVALISFALPSFLRSQIPSNELEALGHIRALASAQNVYHSEHGRYATTFKELATVPTDFLSANWTASITSGYKYSLDGDDDNYAINATPILYETTGIKHFYTDCTGIVRFEVVGGACRYSAPVDEFEVAWTEESL